LKKSWWIVIVLLLCPIVFACDAPLDGKTYTESKDFCGKRYYIPNGISVAMDNVVIDCHNGILQGDFRGTGILAKDVKNIVIKNCNIVNHHRGVHFNNVSFSNVHDNHLIRNFIGLRIENSDKNHFYSNRDVSITKTFRDINSFSNHIKYLNKNIEGDFCRHNSCNERSYEKSLPVYQHYSLAGILEAAIQKFIGMDEYSLQ